MAFWGSTPVDSVHRHILWHAGEEAGDADLDGTLGAVAKHAADDDVADVLHKYTIPQDGMTLSRAQNQVW